jgi:hypothetical protein
MAARSDNRGMSRHQQEFKSTQIFDWASEPADERPTDFARSTGFSALSGFQNLHEAPTPSMRRRQEHRGGMLKLAASAALILGMSGVGLLVMANMLRA